MRFIFLTQEAEHSVTTVLGSSLTVLLSFLILLYLLSKFALKPIMAMMDKRDNQVKEQLDHADQKESQAKEKLAEAELALKEAQEKSQQLLAKAKEAGEKIKLEAHNEAKAEALKLRQETEALLAVERESMVRDVTAQVAGTSVALTEKLLKRELNQEDHQRFITEFIEGLDAS